MNAAGRPLEFDPDIALARATQVFWRQGYEHTSLEDLLTATGLSKSSLYRSFGGKQALFERCMVRYGETVEAGLRAALAVAPSGRDFVEGFLRSALDDARSPEHARGCLVLNTANEFAQREPRIAGCVARELARVQGVLEEAVKRGQSEGGFPPRLEPAAAARYLTSAMSGLKTMAKAGLDAAALAGIVALSLKALD